MARKKTKPAQATAVAAHAATPPVNALANFDWENVTAQVAVPKESTEPVPLAISMGHSWQATLDVPTMEALQTCTTGALQYCQLFPLEAPAVVLIAPCGADDVGATRLYRSRSWARISLRLALEKYRLTWPKDQKLVFPVLKVHTKAYGWVLVLDVAGREHELVEKRAPKANAPKADAPNADPPKAEAPKR